jgi:uncharacterized membrane protein
MKILAGLGALFFFGSEFTVPHIISFLLIGLSVLIMFYDKRLKMKRMNAFVESEKARALEEIALEKDKEAMVKKEALVNKDTTADAVISETLSSQDTPAPLVSKDDEELLSPTTVSRL